MSSARRQTNQQERRARPREADIVAMPMPPQPPIFEREPKPQLERIGDILRRTREKRGDSLQPIAEYLCIRRGFLEALEDSRYEEFPADAYVIGFLRSYAELLGLDGKAAIDHYRAEMAGRRKKPSLILPTPIAEGRSPSVFVLIGALIAAILIYVVWYGLSTSDRATVTAPQALPSAAPVSSTETTTSIPSPSPGIALTAAAPAPVPEVPPAPVVEAAPAPAPVIAAIAIAPAEPAATAPPVTLVPSSKSGIEEVPLPAPTPTQKPHLAIRAEQSSWVLVADSKGKTVFDRVMKPGETFEVPEKSGLTLTTGNAGGLVLTLDGADLPKLSAKSPAGSSGITRDIPLDAGHLKALTQSKD